MAPIPPLQWLYSLHGVLLVCALNVVFVLDAARFLLVCRPFGEMLDYAGRHAHPRPCVRLRCTLGCGHALARRPHTRKCAFSDHRAGNLLW
ncbi:hypothetical protein CGRA01v4_04339 [Colletotrichum graminicola]|nr:hypothetical protein CGRA01v4_04339 [Colletotrichum graminicola]